MGSQKDVGSTIIDTIGYQQLQRWLLSCQDECVHACLEATGQYGDGVAEYLYAENHQVRVVNPARIKRYGESKLHRNKTDKADAFLIAESLFERTTIFVASIIS